MDHLDAEFLPSLEEQVQILKERLAQAQKLTALGELVSTTTHEFNNVLTTIINYAKMGLRNADQESRDKAFDKILSSSQRAAKITNGILAMARNRATAMEPVNLSALVVDTMLLLERELRKYHVAVQTYFNEVPPILGCATQLQQVLLNLLINARQAMPQGGRIVMRIQLDAEGQWVELVVRDFGCGMSPEQLCRIFEPFFTTKTPDGSGKGGTGLGLSLCRDIMESHQGKIRVESTPGKGTAFTLRFPVAVPAGTNAAQAPAQAPAQEVAALPAPTVGGLPGTLA